MKRLFPLLCLAAVLTAWGYDPPTDEQGGVVVSVLGFDENLVKPPTRRMTRVVDGTKPLDVRVTVSNRNAVAVSGVLCVSMNDDWTLDGATETRLDLASGEGRAVALTARARPRVLSAAYPIHARFERDGVEPAHAVAIFRVGDLPRAKAAEEPFRVLRGVTRLDADVPFALAVERKGQVTALPPGPARGTDPAGVNFVAGLLRGEDVERRGFRAHPPWKGGAGTLRSDFDLNLPDVRPIVFRFATAKAKEKPSDGTDRHVLVLADGVEKELYSYDDVSAKWTEHAVDLSAYAGRRIVLRLRTGPGPKMITNSDSCFWGDPVLVCGETLAAESDASRMARQAEAVRLARRALKDGTSPADGRFVLVDATSPSRLAERYGVGVVPGRQGALDALVAFSDGVRDYSFAGFACAVDGRGVGVGESVFPVSAVTRSAEGDALVIVHETEDCKGRPVSLRVRLRADRGVLRVAWDMPGAVRGKDGSPRYTHLANGVGSLPPERVYAGFGNVFARPAGLNLRPSGFELSTRHSGADFANGLSLVVASDVFPDGLSADCGARTFSLATHHDATFLFAPSSCGAFDAARRYAAVCGFTAAPGVRGLIGRMCLDQWGGDFLEAADGLARAAVYGLGGSVFVRHGWQRWGYDYRLPDICPPCGDGHGFRRPRGDSERFLRMRAAAKEAGMIFVPHDNYIDFYPDAEGYSYDRMLFLADGRPDEAWFNKGRGALSYRWAPHAFAPFQERNLKLMRTAFDPDGLFIDVFSAHAPTDYYDRDGVFHGKREVVDAWSAAFDRPRQMWEKPCAPMVSEAGGDWLIGHLDAGQSDHFVAARWAHGAAYDDAERVPWHDIVSHGKFVLMAGGLGPRYCATDWENKGDDLRHGYASDDYLCTTVIGGRLPMCVGPFTRRAVLTCWMLRDVCAELGAGEMRALGFDETIHRQHATFSTGEVWINRETNRTWRVAGRELPSFGFYVKTEKGEAGVERRDGLRVGFARTAETLFSDARPRQPVDGPMSAKSRPQPDEGIELNRENRMVDFGGIRTSGAVKLEHGADWRLLPLPRTFGFKAEIDLAKFGAAGRKVSSLKAELADRAIPSWKQDGDVLTVDFPSDASPCHMCFED